jgi:hypothetical protein
MICESEINNPPLKIDKKINPNCLRVDSATIFLTSHSNIALILAINKVQIPNHKQLLKNALELKLNRINIHKPAVTKVELCTKALTGVGAAMAAGNQFVQGSCALLVIDIEKSTNTNPSLNQIFF